MSIRKAGEHIRLLLFCSVALPTAVRPFASQVVEGAIRGTVSHPHISIHASEQAKADFSLTPGNVTRTVEVGSACRCCNLRKLARTSRSVRSTIFRIQASSDLMRNWHEE